MTSNVLASDTIDTTSFPVRTETCEGAPRLLLKSQHAISLTSEEELRLVVMPDEHGHYHFDEMGDDNLPEYLGYQVGYLSGPLAPQEVEHDTEPVPATILKA